VTRDDATALGCGAVSATAGLAAMIASQDGSLHPSALVHISSQEPLAALARSSDPHFHFVTPVQHYDGAYYYAMARDPFLRGQAHTLIDQPAYRYGHPLHGWLAGLLSFGQAREVPLALLLLSLIGLAVGGWTASRLAVYFGRTPWGGLIFAVSPGLLFAATVSTTETLGAALVALTFLAWVRGRFGWATVLVVALCLDKEQFITVPIGLAVWELVSAWRGRGRPDEAAVKAAAVVLGPVVLTGWYVYVHSQLHQWPWSYQSGNLGRPFVGWKTTFRLAHVLAGGSFDQSEIGSVTTPMLVAVAVIILVAVVAALPVRTVLDAPLLLTAVITSLQGWRTLLYPHELVRTPAVALLLAVAVLTTRPHPPPSLEPTPSGP
jgi:hypothetical protein